MAAAIVIRLPRQPIHLSEIFHTAGDQHPLGCIAGRKQKCLLFAFCSPILFWMKHYGNAGAALD